MKGILCKTTESLENFFLLDRNLKESMKLFFYWNDIEKIEILKFIKYKKFYLEKFRFNLILDDDNKILNNTCLNTHNVIKNKNINEDMILKSFIFIKNINEDYYKLVINYIINIWILEIKSEYKGIETEITSCTVPSIPYTIFLSEKALYHIPPKNIFSQPSIFILAENIFHEAIHCAINYQVIFKDIFIDDYDNLKSSKIFIPWRQDQKEERNKYWEIDRVYHATIVYKNIINFRKKLIEKNILSENEKKFLLETLDSSINSFNYLLKELKKNINYFSKDGIKSLEELEYETY